MNGVTAAALQDGMSNSGIQAGTVDPLSSGGVVATREQVNVPTNEAIQLSSCCSWARPDASYNKCGAGRRQRAVSASVQQGSSSLTVVRWITRLNEYLAAQGQTVFGSVWV